MTWGGNMVEKCVGFPLYRAPQSRNTHLPHPSILHIYAVKAAEMLKCAYICSKTSYFSKCNHFQK